MDISDKTRATYKAYHEAKGPDRNDLLRNPEVLSQWLASNAALFRALARIDFSVGQRVVDVGGGSGGSLLPFMEVGCPADTLTSLDVLSENTEAGRRRFPGISFHACDARRTPFDTGSFDIAYSSTVFFQITDAQVAQDIGLEMKRIVRHGGHIVVRDWSLADPRDKTTAAVTRKRMGDIFGLPIAFSEVGALPPPIGRRLSRYAPWAYALVQRICPAGQRVYVLKVDHVIGAR